MTHCTEHCAEQCLTHTATHCFGHGSEQATCRCPNPSLPNPTTPNQPGPTLHHLFGENFGEHQLRVLPYKQLSRARKREAPVTAWCWACDSLVDADRCGYCHAPHWGGWIDYGQPDDRPGVYVLASDVGMFKIGMSKRGVAGRVAQLISQARLGGTACWLECWLPEATPRVEWWLHQTFAETRDPTWAAAEWLPNPTEWFWPTPALRALARNLPLVDYLEPHLEAPA